MTKATMILEADKLDIANKDDLFDDILAGNVTETMLKKLQANDLKQKGASRCQIEL